MKEELKNMQSDKEQLCKHRLNYARRNKTQPWTMKQLEVVLKNLKKNKCRDPLGYANEIFRSEIAGDDLHLINSIYKNKGSRSNFNNYLGIFSVPIFRSIL